MIKYDAADTHRNFLKRELLGQVDPLLQGSIEFLTAIAHGEGSVIQNRGSSNGVASKG